MASTNSEIVDGWNCKFRIIISDEKSSDIQNIKLPLLVLRITISRFKDIDHEIIIPISKPHKINLNLIMYEKAAFMRTETSRVYLTNRHADYVFIYTI